MTVLEAIEMFKAQMIGEIGHSAADQDLQESLIEATKEVAQTVIDTYHAEK